MKPSFYIGIIFDIVRYMEVTNIITSKGFIKPTQEQQRLVAEYISDILIQRGLSTSEALVGKIELVFNLLLSEVNISSDRDRLKEQTK